MLSRAVFRDSSFAGRLCGETVSFSHQPNQHMLGPDVVMSQLPHFLLSHHDDVTRLHREPLTPAESISRGRPVRATTTPGLALSAAEPTTQR